MKKIIIKGQSLLYLLYSSPLEIVLTFVKVFMIVVFDHSSALTVVFDLSSALIVVFSQSVYLSSGIVQFGQSVCLSSGIVQFSQENVCANFSMTTLLYPRR